MVPAKTITFSKLNRITKADQLYYVLRHGKKIAHKWLTLCIIRRQDMFGEIYCKNNNTNRLGIIFKKNTFKKAVERNQFKRVAREFCRTQKFLINNTYDIVIYVTHSPDITEKTFYLKEIKYIFKKGKVLC